MPRPNRNLLLAAVLLFLGDLSFAAKPAHKPAPIPPVSSQESNNMLTFDLYNQFKSASGNVFFSPFSISSALAMTAEGARGKTADEMLGVLHLTMPAGDRRAGYSAMLKEVNKPDKGYELATSNNLWPEMTYPILQTFLDVTSKYYGATVYNLDFIHDNEKSRKFINTTVTEQTQGKIKDLFAPGAIGTDTRLVLTNAVYFKGLWTSKFDEKTTHDGDFHMTASQKATVPLMHQKIKGEIEDYYGAAKVMELSYQGGDVSMLVFLPEPGGMGALEEKMTGPDFNSWLAARKTGHGGDVFLTLPRFKFDASYDLTATLSTMGMKTAFTGAADFTGISTTPGLAISKVVHKAFVMVDEKGTEAAAATGVGMVACSMRQINEFDVDHPFIFILYEKTIGTVLFMGRVVDPR